MSLINCTRSGCKDVFNSFLVSAAVFAGVFEFPIVSPTDDIPNKLIAFSKCISSKQTDCWVHFYEDDVLFERLWRNPNRYLETLKKYKGVILPDFSLYRDMPLVMQLWNIYRSRAIGAWLQKNGVKVIPNVRFGDKRTYKICCDGISKHSVIAVGSHGNMRNPVDRKIFLKGLDTVVGILKPSVIIIYGAASKRHYQKYLDAGIRIIQFDSDFATFRRRVV